MEEEKKQNTAPEDERVEEVSEQTKTDESKMNINQNDVPVVKNTKDTESNEASDNDLSSDRSEDAEPIMAKHETKTLESNTIVRPPKPKKIEKKKPSKKLAPKPEPVQPVKEDIEAQTPEEEPKNIDIPNDNEAPEANQENEFIIEDQPDDVMPELKEDLDAAFTTDLSEPVSDQNESSSKEGPEDTENDLIPETAKVDANIDKETDSGESDIAEESPKTFGEKCKAFIKNHKVLSIVCAVILGILIIGGIIVAAGWSSIRTLFWQTVDLNNYVDVVVSGYDGYGVADPELNTSALIDDINETNDVNPEHAALEITSAVSLSINQDHDLSNGDTVIVSWEVDEEILQDLALNITYSDLKATVKDLPNVESMDVFDDIELTYSGVSPLGKVTLTTENEFLLDSDFTIDKTEGLANGDEITISFTAPEGFEEKAGFKAESAEKTVTVEGLSEYAEAFSDIADSPLASLLSSAKEAGTNLFNSTSDTVLSNQMFGKAYDSFVKDGSPYLVAAYFLTAKHVDEASFKNQAKFVYAQDGKITIPIEATTETTTTSSETTTTTESINETQTGTVYYVVTFANLSINANGSLDSIPDPTTSSLYKSLDSLYKENVTDQRTDNTVLVYDENLTVQ